MKAVYSLNLTEQESIHFRAFHTPKQIVQGISCGKCKINDNAQRDNISAQGNIPPKEAMIRASESNCARNLRSNWRNKVKRQKVEKEGS